MAAAAPPPASSSSSCVTPATSSTPLSAQALAAQCADYVALEGRGGVALAALLRAVDPREDAALRRFVWRLLQRQCARGVLLFFRPGCTANSATEPVSTGTGSKKRKRPNAGAAASSSTLEEQFGGGAASEALSARAIAALTLDDALAAPLGVAACVELRLRALNVPVRAIRAEIGAEHLAILEAAGRARVAGVTVTGLAASVTVASSSGGAVKRLHNALDTLISYGLVVKRIMIVTRPTMRRLNIVHLPRFAADFAPHMFDASAEFESDDAWKRIICAAAEAYLRSVPGYTCVLTDLGRDLNLQKRHIEILRNHVTHESKKDEHFTLELFQAVLRSTKRKELEPKILNCIRYKPSTTSTALVVASQARRGIVLEMGLLRQIYSVIEESGEHGATIVDMRSQIVLPGSRMPYKLVSILAGTYGLKAETIIQGKNKAFRLYVNSAPTMLPLVSRTVPLLLANAPANDNDAQPSESFAIRSNLALKSALGGQEVDSTRSRRRTHILQRLVVEKIISLSSLRTSVFEMEKQLAEMDSNGGGGSISSQFPSAVGKVDTRSISRIAEELESEGSLRLLQLPLPAKNVSTKFRALKCVVFPGFEHDERYIQTFVENYCRDERLRRIQLAPQNQVIRLDDDSELPDEDDDGVSDSGDNDERMGTAHDLDIASAGGTPVYRPGKQIRGVKRRREASVESSEGVDRTTEGGAIQVYNGEGASRGADGDEDRPVEITYRIRRFVDPGVSGAHTHQYRKLGFAYGVMYRCKIFHKYLWDFLHDPKNTTQYQLRDETSNEVSIDDDDEDDENELQNSGIVFSRESVLHSMPVDVYIQAFSGGEILSASEVLVVKEAIENKRSFSELPHALCSKIWSHESKRTAKVLGSLTDLGLVTPHKIGMKSLIKILRAGYSDGRDGVLSRALEQNALGGLFRLQNRTRIVLNDKVRDSHSQYRPLGGHQHRQQQQQTTESEDDEQQPQGINELSEIRLVGMTEKRYSFANILPLRFTFENKDEVDRYWEALECLCLEQMVMEVAEPKPNEPNVCEVPKPVKTRASRMLRILAWISKSQKPPPKPRNGKSGRIANSQKQRGVIVSRAFYPRDRRRRQHHKTSFSRAAAAGEDGASRSTKNRSASTDDEFDGWSSAKPHRGSRSSDHAGRNDTGEDDNEKVFKSLLWTEEQDKMLLELFIENCRSRWKVPVPQGLRRDSESVAFRNPTVSRLGFGLVPIARKLGKRQIDVKKRLRERLLEPAAKLVFESAKREAIAQGHPSGVFDEEVAIMQSTRLTALFRRAVMMVVSPQVEYHPLVAEGLISFWTAQEIRLVWRYLWLKNWIVRSTEKERNRYTTTQRLLDSLKVTTLSYPLWLFRQAAEHESMVSSTLEEESASAQSGIDGGDTSGSPQPKPSDSSIDDSVSGVEQLFEAEFPVNATPGQCALELGCQVVGTCSLVATYFPDGDQTDEDAAADAKKQGSVAAIRRRNMRFLNDKSLKGSTGFAAHLAKHVKFQRPSRLMDSWHVETKMHAVTVTDRDQLQQLEAFSLGDHNEVELLPLRKRLKSSYVGLADAVISLVTASGEEGVSLSELTARLRRWSPTGESSNLREVTLGAVRTCLDTLVDDGALLCVNAYTDQRFVTSDYSSMWLLRPYTLFSLSSTSGKKRANPRVIYDEDKDLLSFPWLKMDGGSNHKFLFAIQRKLLSFVLQAPGIDEQSLFVKMEKLLTLQDTREALSMLADEGLVYVRAASVEDPVSLFGNRKRKEREVVVNIVRDVLAVDRTRFVLHYFPHLECIQRFGNLVQDYQNEAPEFHRGHH